MDISKLKDTVQDCHLSFLIGSGFSMPYLKTLGNIELLLTALANDTELSSGVKDVIRASILGKFFKVVVSKNVDIIKKGDSVEEIQVVLDNYKAFLSTLNSILLKRKSTILNKQINLFTTNVDVFFEKALEDVQVEFNDGFSGRISPTFSITNFSKTVFKNSLHFNNSSEVPVFNLIKVHGSLTWKLNGEKIIYSNLEDIAIVESLYGEMSEYIIDFPSTCGLDHFTGKAEAFLGQKCHANFLAAYKKLTIINPTKDKFHDTIINLNYYEMLGVFSNELEKENSLLFILGFSMADEHIREIILRAANSNPTLQILVFCYSQSSRVEIEKNIDKGNARRRFNNIQFVEPGEDRYFDFSRVNSDIFQELLNELEK